MLFHRPQPVSSPFENEQYHYFQYYYHHQHMSSSSNNRQFKSTIAFHDENDEIIIHRNGRGFLGNVHTWTTYFGHQDTKTYKPSKLFAIFHLLRNPYLWHLILPLTFLSLAIVFFIEADYYYPIADTNSTTSNKSGTGLYIPSGVNAILLLFAFLSATVILRVISPLFLSEKGHRTDLRLPIDVRINLSSQSAAADEPPSSSSPSSALPSSPGTFSFDENHTPFTRVPLTPKAIGFFAAIMFHPISQLILLFTNAFMQEGYFFITSNNGNAFDGESPNQSLLYSPIAFVSSWFTFDFIKYTPSLLRDNPEISCGLGRFWYWFVVVIALVFFYGVVIGILSSSAQMKMSSQGSSYKDYGRWSLIWSVGLAFFPILYRVLFTGFSCFSTSYVSAFYSNNNNDNTNFTTTSPVASSGNLNQNQDMLLSIPVISICPSQRCDSDSQTGTIIFSFIILIITLPIFFNIHTQLRRLSGTPSSGFQQKVQPLPRVDGLHLYLWILSRFLVPAFSGVLGNLGSLSIVSIIIDSLLAFVTWRSPSVSNVEVINFWYKKWAIPGSFSVSIVFCLWTVLVWNHDTVDIVDTDLGDVVRVLSIVLQASAVLIPILIFVPAYIEFKNHFRKRGGGNVILTNMEAMLRFDVRGREGSSYRPSLSPLNRRKSSSSAGGGAIGGAVESASSPSSVKRTAADVVDQNVNYSPMQNENNNNNIGNDADEASPTPRNNESGGRSLSPDEQQPEVFLHDEADGELVIFGKKDNDKGYDDPLGDISSHVSFG